MRIPFKVIASKIPNSLAQLCSLVFGLLVAFLVSWRLALASVPFAIGFIAPGVGFRKLMMNTGVKSKDAYGVAGGIVEQAISNIRTVYSYVGERKTVERSCMSSLPNVPFIVEASAAAKRIFEMIDRIPYIDSETENGKILATVKGQIEFREVHFSYPSRKDEPILQGLNLKVKHGKKSWSCR